MAFSQDDLNAIASAQAQYPLLGQDGISLLGVASLETGGSANPDTAVSSTGAQGLFQVLPSTATDPGYGVSPLTDSSNPTDSANFAGAYLTGLIQSGDTPAQAIQAYSGGGYTLSQVQQAATVAGSTSSVASSNGGTFTNVGAFVPGGIPLQNRTQTPTATIADVASGTYSWIVELVERGGIVILGVAILIVGLVFLLKDASIQSVKFSTLGAMSHATV